MQLLPPVLRLMLLPVLNVLGPIIIGFSLSMLIPLALSLWKNDGASAGFEIAFCITFFTGLLMWLLTRRYKREADSSGRLSFGYDGLGSFGLSRDDTSLRQY
ncbi:MAG: hypothetical protein ACLRRK_11255 [Parasutterella sp.]